MSFITISVIALGLAMDAFAVSITSGITLKDLRIRNAATIALFFGSFQAFMPLIGWLAGLSARAIITGVDHWIAFGLLSLIGCKMIYEATKLGPDENKLDPLNILVLLFLAIATSIDALAVGLSLSFLKIAIVTPALIIGATTFLLSFFGVFLGNISGHFFENKIEIIGGLILIGIGIKIVIEHIVLDVA
jgi:putative Mn2+ efflux pump MntP